MYREEQHLMNSEIQSVAKRLVARHAKAEPSLREALLFPADDEIRLVEVDRDALPSEGTVTPYGFGADVVDGIPYKMWIALILPEDKNKATLPEGWGTWRDAMSIWKKRAAPARKERQS
jgi:hypothetical protein